VSRFAYLDLVLQDTPVDHAEIEEDLRASVRAVDNLSDRDEEKVVRLDERFKRVGKFIQYLIGEEDRERAQFELGKLDSLLARSIVGTISAAFEKERAVILARVRANRERYAEEMDIEIPAEERALLLIEDDSDVAD
jgi:hypothetical protein